MSDGGNDPECKLSPPSSSGEVMHEKEVEINDGNKEGNDDNDDKKNVELNEKRSTPNATKLLEEKEQYDVVQLQSSSDHRTVEPVADSPPSSPSTTSVSTRASGVEDGEVDLSTPRQGGRRRRTSGVLLELSSAAKAALGETRECKDENKKGGKTEPSAEEGEVKTRANDDNEEKSRLPPRDYRAGQSRGYKKSSKRPPARTSELGVYIPPSKRLELQKAKEESEGKSVSMSQRESWDLLRKSIHGTINRLNSSTMKPLIGNLFEKANLIRGRGLLARALLKATQTSPSYANVYAALIAVINTKLPEVGELVLSRAILSFRRFYRRRDRAGALAMVQFLGHLVNQQMCHELLALQIVTVLLEGDPTDDSVEICVSFIKTVGTFLEEVSPAGTHAVFERLRGILHEGEVGKRVQYEIEQLFEIRKGGFRDYPTIVEELDLVESEDQITFELGLDDENLKKMELLDVFREEDAEEFEGNERLWAKIRGEILGESGSDSGSSGGDSDTDSDSASGVDSESDNEEPRNNQQLALIPDQKLATTQIQDLSESDLIHLRRTIYLTIMSSATFEECAHKLARMSIPEGRECELINMIIECCSQERTFLRYYGLVSQRFCLMHRRWTGAFDVAFREQYGTIHRLETNKLRNVAKLFAHLLHTDALPWTVLECIRLNEDDTTSSSRIFVKILVQEMAEAIGIQSLKDRFDDQSMEAFFGGMFPKDANPRNTRYAINFFTSIGLGPLTDGLREYLKNAPKLILQQAQAQAALIKAQKLNAGNDTDSSSSSTSSSSVTTSSTSSGSSTGSSSFTSTSSRSYRRGGRRRRNSYSSDSSTTTNSSRSYSSSSSRGRRRGPDRHRRTRGRSRSKSFSSRSSSYSSRSSSSSSRSRSNPRHRGRRPPRSIRAVVEKGFKNKSSRSRSGSPRNMTSRRSRSLSRSPSPRHDAAAVKNVKSKHANASDNNNPSRSNSRSRSKSSSPSPQGKNNQNSHGTLSSDKEDTRKDKRQRRRSSGSSSSVSSRAHQRRKYKRRKRRSPTRNRSSQSRSPDSRDSK